MKICEEKHVFHINEYSQKIFICVSKTFPLLQQNSKCFPCLEKVRTKFLVFPVPLPPCLRWQVVLRKFFRSEFVSSQTWCYLILMGRRMFLRRIFQFNFVSTQIFIVISFSEGGQVGSSKKKCLA